MTADEDRIEQVSSAACFTASFSVQMGTLFGLSAVAQRMRIGGFGL